MWDLHFIEYLLFPLMRARSNMTARAKIRDLEPKLAQSSSKGFSVK